jgi:hypothetical protein
MKTHARKVGFWAGQPVKEIGKVADIKTYGKF